MHPRRALTASASFARIFLLTAAVWGGGAHAHASDSARQPVEMAKVELQKRLEDGAQVDGRAIDVRAVKSFYQSRNFRPAWSNDKGPLPRAGDLVAVLAKADTEGLDPRTYHIAAITARQAAMQAPPPAQALAEFDMLLTDAALRYAADMRGARVRLEDEGWKLAMPSFNPVEFLKEAVQGDNFAAALDRLPPSYAGYARLRDSLAKFRLMAKAGGWPTGIPFGPSIKPGMSDDRIPLVRQRLMASGELPPGDINIPVLDDALQDALRLFQSRHGLTEDGTLGRQTLTALNVPVESRIEQIMVNMERWRWLPRSLEASHIAVNIPGSTLDVVDDGKVVLHMRTIVGAPDHPTPSFRGSLNAVTLNPVWNVPSSIASKEILPKLKKDPNYLVANGLRIVSDDGLAGDGTGTDIDWKQYRTNMPFQLRQESGDDNSLGRVKFSIPNPDDIYLHDTNSRHLFSRANRYLSHGCVRVQMPQELAELILTRQPRTSWTAEKINQAIDSGETKMIQLSKPLPVYLLYWTAWVDANGVTQFRDDVYGRDRNTRAAMSKRDKAVSMVAQDNPPGAL